MRKKCNIILLSVFIILSLFSCNKKEMKIISLPENKEVLLNTIPTPGKRITINPKLPLRNIKLTYPDNTISTLDIEKNPTIVLYEKGDYTLTYEFCYEDVNKAIVGKIPGNDKEWKSGSLSFSITNFEISEPYNFKKSKNLTFAWVKPSSPYGRYSSYIEVINSKPSSLYLVQEKNSQEFEWFLCEINEIKKIRISLFFNFIPNVRNKIGFKLKEKDSNKIIDELFVEIYPSLIQNNYFFKINEKKESFLKHVIYYIEDGDVFCYDFKNNKYYKLNEGYFIKTISLSPDGSYLVFSSRNSSYISKFNGEEFTKIADDAIEPIFAKNHSDFIFLIQSKDKWKFGWNEKKQQNEVQAEIYTFNIKEKKLKSHGYFSFPVTENYTMYDPDFLFKDFYSYFAIIDLSNIKPILSSHPYEKDDLLTIKIDSYNFKNLLFNGKDIREFQNDVSFMDERPSIGHIIWKNELREAIILGTEVSPYGMIKYIEESQSRLGSVSERDEYLCFIRYRGDIYPSSNIEQMQEVYSELCIYNKYLNFIKAIPVRGLLYKVLLPYEYGVNDIN
ncbi:MAG: hypothetical protein QMD25_07005 [Caldisericia bacterium]|nr:hypothetical protein [Caldisericia bacterium]